MITNTTVDIENTQGVKSAKIYMDKYFQILKLKSLLSWVWNTTETYDMNLGPYRASFDSVKQKDEWHCFGCSGIGISSWPDWKLDFKHEPDCRYIELKNLMEKE